MLSQVSREMRFIILIFAIFLASCGDDGAIQIWEMDTGEHVTTLRRDRPYERLNITGIKGLSDAQKQALKMMGAVEKENIDE